MIDVHLITRDGDRQDWLEQAVASVHHPRTKLQIIDGNRESLYRNRWAGFWAGSAPYVSFIDPDDWVEPGAWDALVAAIEANPGRGLYFTDEAIVDESGRRMRLGESSKGEVTLSTMQMSHLHAHHLIVMDRKRFIDAQFATGSECKLPEWRWSVHAAHAGGFVHVPVVGYNWRVRRDGTHRSISAADVTDAREALWRSLPSS